MLSSTLTRRRMLRFAGASLGLGALTACGATAVPEAGATPNVSATDMVVAAQATEDAIAAQARADEALLTMSAEEYAALTEKELAEAADSGKTVIELLSAYGTIIDDRTAPHQFIIRDFMERNPDIYVKYSPSSAYAGAFNEVILMRMASGDPPDCILHYSAPIAYAARGTCQAVDDLMDVHPMGNKDAFEPAALEQLMWDGKTWGLPLNGSQTAMWYNLDVLEAKGLPIDRDSFPKTLDELMEWSAIVNEWAGDTMTSIGAAPWASNWSWPGKMVAAGGLLWDGATYTINDPKNAELIEYWIAWIEAQYKGDVDLLASQGSLNSPYPEGLFGLGVQAICDDGLWALSHTPPDIRYEVGPMPTGLSGTRPATSNWPNLMFIPTGAAHTKEAFELCAYYATEGQIEWWNRWSDVPYWLDFPTDVAPADLIARVGEEKAFELTQFARDYSEEIVVQWNSPVEDFATDEIFRAVDSALHKQQPVQAALDAAQELVMAKLQEVVSGG